MYPDSGYKLAHAQSVCTRPFSPRWEGPGDEARVVQSASASQLSISQRSWANDALRRVKGV